MEMTFYYSGFESNNNRTTYGSYQKDPKTIDVTYLENVCPSGFVLGSQIDGQMDPSLAVEMIRSCSRTSPEKFRIELE